MKVVVDVEESASPAFSLRIDTNRATDKSRSCRCHPVAVAPFKHRCPTGFLCASELSRRIGPYWCGGLSSGNLLGTDCRHK